ncbi:MAG: DinB family protein [Flavobacteriales bacterium]|nr:DinB family protein [Flavobacteriales bacterium]
MEYDKKEIISQLEKQSKAIRSWFLDKPIEKMEAAPDGAWTAGQHLLHLVKSTKPLAKGMGYPRILLLLKFGKAKRPSRSYEDTIKAYTDALSNGGKAMGEYVPRAVKKEEREVLVERFKEEMGLLINQVHQWSESNLDSTAVPHPLIGNLTLREMLYFTIYHMEHHLNSLNERYS